jgi:hypothetical protein
MFFRGSRGGGGGGRRFQNDRENKGSELNNTLPVRVDRIFHMALMIAVYVVAGRCH